MRALTLSLCLCLGAIALSSCNTYKYNCTCKDASKCDGGQSAGFNSDKEAIAKEIKEKEAKGYTCTLTEPS